MNNEEKELETTTMDEDYIQTINDLKANTVSKEEYLKLKEDNKKLLNSLVNGEKVANTPEPLKDIRQLRKEFENCKFDLASFEKALELRDEVLKQTGEDKFVALNPLREPTQKEYEDAELAYQGIKYCIERANGDPELFTSELQRIMVDPISSRNKR